MSAPPPPGPLPDGFGIALDRSLRRLDGGRTLLGGAPTRLLRLTPAGAAALDRWVSGGTPAGVAERALARRLVAAGLAHPLPPAGPLLRGSVTVVIPARDRAAQLARCLAALDAPGARTIVVDDGSQDPAAIARAAAAAGAEVVRHARPRGPSAARNTGAARSATPLVAFVDADCVPTAGWLERLASHFADPGLAAVAPRIVAAAPARPGRIPRYEADRSPLDMGAYPGAVGPTRPVPYVPSAALVVRRAALDGGGFDERLRVGEDVDLAWRLHAAGWTVRYDPAAAVAHQHRETPGPWLRQRFAYGTSAGRLARLHPGALPAVVLTPWSAATWLAFATGCPRSALAAAAAGAALVRARLGRRVPESATLSLTASGLASTGRALAVALTRTWLPLSACAALRSRRARGVVAAAAAARTVELARAKRQLPLPSTAALALADDAAYAAGLWWGCMRDRSLAPLLPRFATRRARATAAGSSPSGPAGTGRRRHDRHEQARRPLAAAVRPGPPTRAAQDRRTAT